MTITDTHTHTHTHTHKHSVGLPWTRDRPVAHNAQHSQDTNIHARSGIRTRNPRKRAAIVVGLIKHIPWWHERKELGDRSTHFGSGEVHAMAFFPTVLITLEAEGNPKVIWYIRRTQKCLPQSVIWPQFAGYPANNVVAVSNQLFQLLLIVFPRISVINKQQMLNQITHDANVRGAEPVDVHKHLIAFSRIPVTAVGSVSYHTNLMFWCKHDRCAQRNSINTVTFWTLRNDRGANIARSFASVSIIGYGSIAQLMKWLNMGWKAAVRFPNEAEPLLFTGLLSDWYRKAAGGGTKASTSVCIIKYTKKYRHGPSGSIKDRGF